MTDSQNNQGLHPIPDSSPSNPPKVIFWYKLYCVLMTFVYFLMIAAGIILIIFHNSIKTSQYESSELLIMGIVYAAIGLVLFIGFGVSFFLPRRFWAWVYHLVLICIGLTSCCCLPVTVPLLIFWFNQETKSYFRNNGSPGGEVVSHRRGCDSE